MPLRITACKVPDAGQSGGDEVLIDIELPDHDGTEQLLRNPDAIEELLDHPMARQFIGEATSIWVAGMQIK